VNLSNEIGWDRRDRLEALFGVINQDVARVLERSLDHVEMDFDEGLLLAETSGLELEALVLAADQVRRQRVGDVVTYVVNRNINFTNVCFVGCRFCAFSRAPRERDAYFLSLDEVGRRARQAWDQGAREVCVQGGLPRGLVPPLTSVAVRAVAMPRLDGERGSPRPTTAPGSVRPSQ